MAPQDPFGSAPIDLVRNKQDKPLDSAREKRADAPGFDRRTTEKPILSVLREL